MAASVKDQFEAAVKLIQSLPKQGSFQPSHDMMLKFYGCYKQATLGPCKDPKPSFWEVVKKAKWEAWNSLGDLPQEDAMHEYISELKKIVETMPQTENVSSFLDKVGAFYELVDERLPGLEKATTIPNERHRKDSKSDDSKLPNGAANTSEDGGMDESDLDTEVITIEKEIGNEANEGNTGWDSGFLSHETEIIPVKRSSSSESYVHVEKTLSLENVNGVSPDRHFDMSGDSDTDSEIFCDTSDQPPPVFKVSEEIFSKDIADGSPNTSSTPVKLSNGGTQISTESINAFQYQPVKHTDSNNSLSKQGQASQFDGLTVQQSSTTSSSHQRQLFNSGTTDTSHSLEQSSESIKHYGLPKPEMLVGRGSNTTPTGQGRGQMGHGSGHSGTGVQLTASSSQSLLTGGHGASMGGGSGSGGDEDGATSLPHHTGVNEQIAIAIGRLQHDMNIVLTRLGDLETNVKKVKESKVQSSSSRWWPFSGLSGRTTFFLLVWPLIVNWILRVLFYRRRSRRS